MKKVIRRVSLIAMAVVLCLGCFLLFGCGGGGNTVNVTFDLNYEGAEAIASTATDDVVAYPDDPERDGYMFTGWYTDAECTTPFEAVGLDSDCTVYAGWMVHREGYVYITYMWNYEGAGTYSIEEYEYDTPIYSWPNVSRTGYMFDGWYTDAACTQSPTAPYFTDEDTTMYAKWLKEYTFEAECTDLTGRDGELRDFKGYSQTGEPVWKDSSCSNGYYIGDMYENELYLEFVIYSDEAVDDAVLYLNVAMLFGWGLDSGTVEFTSDDYVVTVNGTAISYSSFSFDVSDLSQGERTTFRDAYIGRISLQEGENVIRLTVNNTSHGQGGSMEAMAPLVDYIKIYTNATLTWTEIDNKQYISSGGSYE